MLDAQQLGIAHQMMPGIFASAFFLELFPEGKHPVIHFHRPDMRGMIVLAACEGVQALGFPDDGGMRGDVMDASVLPDEMFDDFSGMVPMERDTEPIEAVREKKGDAEGCGIKQALARFELKGASSFFDLKTAFQDVDPAGTSDERCPGEIVRGVVRLRASVSKKAGPQIGAGPFGRLEVYGMVGSHDCCLRGCRAVPFPGLQSMPFNKAFSGKRKYISSLVLVN